MASLGDTYKLPAQHIYADDPAESVPDTSLAELEASGYDPERRGFWLPALIAGGILLYMYTS